LETFSVAAGGIFVGVILESEPEPDDVTSSKKLPYLPTASTMLVFGTAAMPKRC
jgi:hypothetical protein